MMRYGAGVPALFCMMASAIASAGTGDIVAANRQVGVHYISTYLDYGETGNGFLGTGTGDLDSEAGSVPGYALSVSSMWGKRHFYAAARFSRNRGSTQYTGAYQGGAYGSLVATSSATLTDSSIRLGKGFAIGDSAMATPYAEVGSHEWDRGVNHGETYAHKYYGAGILAQYSSAASLVISVNLLAGATFASTISAGGPYGFSARLGNGPLYRGGLSVDYAFTGRFHGNAGVDYARFKYGMSSPKSISVGGVQYAIWEPDSSTKYLTIQIGVGYSF